MANYTSNLKTWGASGVEHPDGYSYTEGEQPVDDWDNFVNSNVIADLQHLVSLTTNRIESERGTLANRPASGEEGELYYVTDRGLLSWWNDHDTEWSAALDRTGDSMTGDLVMYNSDITTGTGQVLNIRGDSGVEVYSGGTRVVNFASNGNLSVPNGNVTANQLMLSSVDLLDNGGNPEIALDGNGTISRFGSTQIAFYNGRVDINNELWVDGIDLQGNNMVDTGLISGPGSQDMNLWASGTIMFSDSTGTQTLALREGGEVDVVTGPLTVAGTEVVDANGDSKLTTPNLGTDSRTLSTYTTEGGIACDLTGSGEIVGGSAVRQSNTVGNGSLDTTLVDVTIDGTTIDVGLTTYGIAGGGQGMHGAIPATAFESGCTVEAIDGNTTIVVYVLQ